MISYQVPENQWNEDAVKNLPAEDDRFEYKETIDIEKISQEICAFANSFGGTLFLGVEDKNGEFRGVERRKGNKTVMLWLEQIIPVKLEFRFGSFRIREVALTVATQQQIGAEKTVISIDVFDSDLAPYQVVETRKYYRRENSSSKEAPHSYLAYLWSRNSSDKTRVVQHWVTDFVTPMILFAETINETFQQLKFWGTYQTIGGENFILFHFIDWKSWNELLKKLAGKQFLRANQRIEPLISDLTTSLSVFENFFNEFTSNLLTDKRVVQVFREKYDLYLSQQGLMPQASDSSVNYIQMLRALLVDRQVTALAADTSQMTAVTARFMSYALFGFQLRFADWKDEGFMNFCSTLINEVKNDKHFAVAKQKAEWLRKEVVLKAQSLSQEMDVLREELSLRHSTTY